MARTQSHITHKITADPALGVFRDLFIRVQYANQEASDSSTSSSEVEFKNLLSKLPVGIKSTGIPSASYRSAARPPSCKPRMAPLSMCKSISLTVVVTIPSGIGAEQINSVFPILASQSRYDFLDFIHSISHFHSSLSWLCGNGNNYLGGGRTIH